MKRRSLKLNKGSKIKSKVLMLDTLSNKKITKQS